MDVNNKVHFAGRIKFFNIIIKHDETCMTALIQYFPLLVKLPTTTDSVCVVNRQTIDCFLVQKMLDT